MTNKEDERNSVYMFHNERYNVHLFTNADGWNQAMTTFDICNFPHRDDWKVYVACGQQPTNKRKIRKHHARYKRF